MRGMIYYVLCVLLSNNVRVLCAQSEELKICKGNMLCVPKGAYASFMFGDEQRGLLYVNSGVSYGLNIHAVDPAKMQVETQPLPTKFYQSGRHHCIDQVVAMKHHYYWFLNAWEPGLHAFKLSAWKFDPKTNRLLSEEMPVANTAWRNNHFDPSDYHSPFMYYLSPDSSRLLINYHLFGSEHRDGRERLGFYVFDAAMHQQMNLEQDMPYDNSKMEVLDMMPDNQGRIYILARVSNEQHFVPEKAGHKQPQYHFEIFKYNAANTEPEVVKLDPGFIFPLSYQLSIAPSGDVFCFGYCSERPLDWRCQYFYRFHLKNAALTIGDVEKQLLPIPESVMYQYENPDKFDDAYDPKGLRPVYFDWLADGTLFVFAEEIYNDHFSSKGFNGIADLRKPAYNDNIYVSRFAPDGKLAWIRKIPKHNQMGLSNETLCNFFKQDQDYLMLYTDNLHNLELPETREAYEAEKLPGLVCARVQADGTVTRRLLYDLTDKRESIDPQLIIPLSDHHWAGLMQNGRKVWPFRLEW